MEGTRAELSALLSFLTTEQEWRTLRSGLEGKDAPEQISERMRQVREQRREDSRAYLVSRVAQVLGVGRSVLDQRLRNLEAGGTGWKGMRRLVRVARAWGTTSRSVRGVSRPMRPCSTWWSTRPASAPSPI
ncbi:hypothetical protein [Nocardiopsis xinjiangensis]|uniref:hypothetical protein n=1 Tax=Nocardiopsis xinjiangensis TaxID=124285 RepID=UPI000346892A|nr:hypothetical protein [Nocardiopsis xinjiangensis]